MGRLSKDKKLEYCRRCRQNFYNGNNDLGIKECWHLKTAKLVTKEIYWSLAQVKPNRIRTLSCFQVQR